MLLKGKCVSVYLKYFVNDKSETELSLGMSLRIWSCTQHFKITYIFATANIGAVSLPKLSGLNKPLKVKEALLYLTSITVIKHYYSKQNHQSHHLLITFKITDIFSIFIYICTHTCIHTHTKIYMYIYTHTHTLIYMTVNPHSGPLRRTIQITHLVQIGGIVWTQNWLILPGIMVQVFT